MKKLLMLSAVVAMAMSLHAQRVQYGIKAGVQSNFLSVKSKTGGNWNRTVLSGIGLQAGGVADIGITNHFSIQPNLLFSMKGVRPSNNTEITLYTIDLPITFLYKTGGFFGGFGPNLSYGISAKQELPSGDDDLYEADGGDPAEFNRFEFGVNTTLGYQFPCGVTLQANYTPGYSNLNNGNDASTIRYNTRIFAFSVGYMFPGKKAARK